MNIQDFIDKWAIDCDKEHFIQDFEKMKQECFDAPILYFRGKLSHIYQTEPLNDEGLPCDPSTVYEVIHEYDKFFNVTVLRERIIR